MFSGVFSGLAEYSSQQDEGTLHSGVKAHFTAKIFLLLTFFYATITCKSEMRDYFHDNIKINGLLNSTV
jgi:hypothetical protein